SPTVPPRLYLTGDESLSQMPAYASRARRPGPLFAAHARVAPWLGVSATQDYGDGVWLVVFFFSSRRRHTRLVSDWSSDVCSSDLFRNLFLGYLLECVQISIPIAF